MISSVLIFKACAVSMLFTGVHPVCHTLSWAVPAWVSLSQRGEPAHGGSAHAQWWHWCWERGVYVLAESRLLWGKTLWYRVSDFHVQSCLNEEVTELVFALPGLRAAEMTALPSTIIQEAKTIASKVSQQLLVWFTKIWFFLLSGWFWRHNQCTLQWFEAKQAFVLQEINIRSLETQML